MLTHHWYTHLSAATDLTERLSILITIAAIAIACPTGAVRADNSTTAVVEFGVTEISEMEVAGALARPVTLSVSPQGSVELDGVGDTYIRYTSVVPDGKIRTISAAITEGSIPDGCRLKVSVTGLSGNGAYGNIVPGGAYLSDTPQAIITGIGNCHTGTGDADGARIECTLEIENSSRTSVDELSPLTVLFTMN